MKYSVYDYTRRAYDYYDAPGPGGTHAGSPPKVASEADLGVSPERSSWKLPMGATKVGSGELPQGRIASVNGSDEALSPISLLMYAALGYVAWKVFR